jgi:hypothetical protein
MISLDKLNKKFYLPALAQPDGIVTSGNPSLPPVSV